MTEPQQGSGQITGLQLSAMPLIAQVSPNRKAHRPVRDPGVIRRLLVLIRIVRHRTEFSPKNDKQHQTRSGNKSSGYTVPTVLES
jgi:hypothetical protein